MSGKAISTKQIGDGRLPNKYWVCISNDYLYNSESNCWDWASDRGKFRGKGKTIRVFKTYKGAIKFIEKNISISFEYDGIMVNCITIEDRFTGQIYQEVNREIIRLEPDITIDTKFTEEAMTKLGAKFK